MPVCKVLEQQFFENRLWGKVPTSRVNSSLSLSPRHELSCWLNQTILGTWLPGYPAALLMYNYCTVVLQYIIIVSI